MDLQVLDQPRHMPFHEIKEFRHVIKTVNERSHFAGLPRKPKITFGGTTKLHGANASIALHRGGEVFCQSREAVCTPELDLREFYRFFDATRLEWQAIFEALLEHEDYADADSIALYGEWCGGGIQRKVALNGLPKMFVLFSLKTQVAGLVRDHGEMVPGFISTYHGFETVRPLLRDLIKPLLKEEFAKSVYCATDFGFWTIEIDFQSPQESQNDLAALTMQVEKECPAGKYFGKRGTGEGVVWTALLNPEVGIKISDLAFKVKGQEHSDTNVRKLASVDVEQLRNAREFAEAVATVHRFEKGVEHLKNTLGEEGVFAKENLSAFIAWVSRDVMKEESDTMLANKLKRENVMSGVSAMAKTWFLSQ